MKYTIPTPIPVIIADTTKNAVELIVHLKNHLPPWVRIQRIQRDIPVQYIEGGVDKSNLRQLAHHALEKSGRSCGCIRCREVGHQGLRGVEPEVDNIKLQTISYEASGGTEVFMSYEDTINNLLVSLALLQDCVSLWYLFFSCWRSSVLVVIQLLYALRFISPSPEFPGLIPPLLQSSKHSQ